MPVAEYIICVKPHTCMYVNARVQVRIPEYTRTRSCTCMHGRARRSHVRAFSAVALKYLWLRKNEHTSFFHHRSLPWVHETVMWWCQALVLQWRRSLLAFNLVNNDEDGSISFSRLIWSLCDISIRIRSFIYVLIWMAQHYHSLDLYSTTTKLLSILFS